jgi:hypothetical protein
MFVPEPWLYSIVRSDPFALGIHQPCIIEPLDVKFTSE